MNPLVKKEIRLLLPGWVAALLLAIAPAWIIQHFSHYPRVLDEIPMSAFVMLGMLFLSIASFGQEFSFNTFSYLLAQPVARHRVWWTKIAMLTLALASTVAAASVSWILFLHWHPAYSSSFFEVFNGVPLSLVVFLSGGLWTALLFRQVAAAFWFTFLVPVGILLVCGYLANSFGGWPNVLTWVLVCYSAMGFIFAQMLYFRAQDVQWTGRDISFPWPKGISVPTGAIVPGGRRNRFATLAWKELQLHQANLFIAALVGVVYLAVIVLHHRTTNPNLKTACDVVCGFVWVLWLFMPVLIGSAAVADERKLGVLEAQFCLPVSRSAQFSIKFFTGLILSLVLGAVAPYVIERTQNFEIPPLPPFWNFYAAAAVYFISFYSSTLGRSVLQSIGLAIAIPVFVGTGLYAFAWLVFKRGAAYTGYENSCRMMLAALMGIPVLLLVLARLMFWNFKWLHQDWKVWRYNAAVILASFAFVWALTNAIFYRPWELLTPMEPAHGAARLTLASPVKLSWGAGGICALLPDGRLRMENFTDAEGRWWVPESKTVDFVGKSNWVEVATDWRQVLGIQADGSLWCVWQEPVQPRGVAFKPTQIGLDTNWAHVAGGLGSASFLLLKEDGSLWRWGTNREASLALAGLPVRMDDKTNWTAVYNSAGLVFAKKNDGGAWCLGPWYEESHWRADFVQETNGQAEYLYACDAEVKTNGTLWFFYGQPQAFPIGVIPTYAHEIQLGREAKWKAASFIPTDGSVLALREDGTLWKWQSLSQSDFKHGEIHAKRLGDHADWVALLSGWNGWGVAVAGDGNLWAWDAINYHSLLAPSRKPELIGNVLSGAN